MLTRTNDSILHPEDALWDHRRRTAILWQFAEIVRSAARAHEEAPAERHANAVAWYEDHVPGGHYVGLADDYKAVPPPVQLLLELLDELENAEADFHRMLRAWCEKDRLSRTGAE
jgi:hypothetical protein